MIYFTSDTHFGHAKIIEYAERPFVNVQHMDRELIAKWNDVVPENAEVWHLGDFCWGDPTPYLMRLNGRIHLIQGNHDKGSLVRDAGFESVSLVHYLRYHKKRFWLSHYAHRTWLGKERGSYHLFGHWHGEDEGFGRSMDVGVDATDTLAPIHWRTVVAKLDAIDIGLARHGAIR